MLPALKSIHRDDQLLLLKLTWLRSQTTAWIVQSLSLHQHDCLKTRPDGTILDGNHRIKVLRERGYDIDALPRDIITKSKIDPLDEGEQDAGSQ